MEIKNISKAGYIFGSLIIGVSLYEWFPADLSQFIFGFGLGCNILAFAYIYSWMKYKDESDSESEKACGKRYDLLYKEIEKLKNGAY